MASKFNLTAQLSLAPPTNVPQIVRQVNSQLQGITMQINPNVNAKSLNQANTAVQKVGVSAKVTSKNLNSAAGSANSLGSALGAAARRFASITLATGFFLALTRALGSAVGRAIEFEKEMLKISQVTGKSIRALGDLSNEVTRLSGNLGVSSEELLNAARTLSQAGFAADKVTGALKILAQTDLAATFDNIKDTTEGAIAILSQFRREVRAAGGEVQFLEMAMDSINAVSKSFAVESADLISVVRRTGGVFEAAGGKLNELIALFTSVRATTRETADTIATGFRTIFTRIQRSETIDSLRELGIVLQDTEGKFVGPMEAIARLSAGLQALDPRDFRFNEIVEQLGGFRQIGKVIPLIKQYTTSTEALSVANNAMGSTARDAGIAQQGLGNQFAQLKEKFDATIRSLADSETFQTLATSAIRLAESILKVVESLEPLLPMLTALAAFKLGQIALPAFGKFAGIGGRHEGGKIHGFAGGGMVPGRGNRDTVPAMLQPGEFVMRKSAVKKIGANNMAEMNNGYAAGGTVTARRSNYGMEAALTPQDKQLIAMRQRKEAGEEVGEGVRALDMIKMADVKFRPGTKRAGGFSLQKRTDSTISGANFSLGQVPASKFTPETKASIAKRVSAKSGEELNEVQKLVNSSTFKSSLTADATFPVSSLKPEGLREATEAKITDMAKQGLAQGVSQTLMDGDFMNALTAGSAKINNQSAGAQIAADNQAVSSVEGFLFEGVVSGITGAMPSGDTKNFDLLESEVSANQVGLSSVFAPASVKQMKMAELKRSSGKLNQVRDKLASHARKNGYTQQASGISFKDVEGFARGGKPKGADTVPAMLTPGEFVLKKSAAQGIGYSNLHRMNQSNGVNGYAAGGIVTGTRGNYGAMPGGTGGGSIGTIPGIESASKGFTNLAQQIGALIGQLMRAGESIMVASTSAAEVLTGGVTEGTAAISSALIATAEGVTPVDDMLREAATASMAVLAEGMSNAAVGISTVDELMKGAITTSLVPLTAGIKKASIDFTVTPKMMQAAITAALKPVEGSFKTLGSDLKAKLTIFDKLSKPISDLTLIMEEFAATLAKQMEVSLLLAPPTEALGVAMGRVAEFLYTSATKIAQHLATGANTLGAAMKTAATQLSGGSKTATLAQPMGQMATQMSLVAKTMSNIVIVSSSLQIAMTTMIQALNFAAENVGKMSVTTMPANTQIAALEAEILQLRDAMKKMELALEQGAGKVATGSTGAMGAAAGGRMMGGGGQAGNQMMMMAMMAGMVATQMGDMSEEMEAAVNILAMLGPILGMVAMELGGMVGGLIANIVASWTNTGATVAESAAHGVNAAATATESAAKLMSSKIIMATSGVMVGLALAITLVAARSAYLAAQAKKLGEEYTKGIKDLKSGEGAMTLGEAKDLASRALQKEAEAAGTSLGYWVAGITAVVAAVALGIATGGASLVVMAAYAATAATAIAAAGAAGAEAGAAFATVEQATQRSSDALVESTWHAVNAMNGLSMANKAIELEQLKGVELMERQGQAFDDFYASSIQAVAGMEAFRGMEAGMDQEFRGEMMDSDIFKEIKDGGVEAMREMSQTWFKMASDMKSGMNQAVDEMIEGGMSVNDAMDSAAIQGQLAKYSMAVQQATRIQMMMSGIHEQEAKRRLGLLGVTEEEMTQAQRINVLNLERMLIEQASIDTANKAKQAQEKSMNERLEADEKARKAAAVTLAANIALARSAEAAAMAMNSFETSMTSFNSTIGMVDSRLGALSGSIKLMKSNAAEFIATLGSGFVTPEAEAAATATGATFGIEAQVDDLLKRIKNSENIRTVLINKGLTELQGGLDDVAASLQLDDFLAANNIDFSEISPAVRDAILGMLKDGLQPEEVGEIMDMINSENEGQIKILQELAKAQQSYVGALFKFGDNIVKASNDIATAVKRQVEVQLRGAERLAKARGEDFGSGQIRAAEERRRNAKVQAAGMVGGGPRATMIQIERKRESQRELQARIEQKQGAGDTEGAVALQNEQKLLANETKILTKNLEELANQSKLASAILSEIDVERGKRETLVGEIRDFAFASNKERKQIDMNFMALQRVLATGNLNSIPDEMRGAVRGLLEKFGNIEVVPGMTGEDVLKQFDLKAAVSLAMRARGRQLTPEEFRSIQEQIFEPTDKEQELIDELKAINAEEQQAAAALEVIKRVQKDDLAAGIRQMVIELKAIRKELGGGAGDALDQPVVAPPKAMGGVVYAAKGKRMERKIERKEKRGKDVAFVPQGTDTVPAMLTPGEFVVNKKAARKNRGALEGINSGKVQYLQGGGAVATSHKSWRDGASLQNYNSQYQTISSSLAGSTNDGLSTKELRIWEDDFKNMAEGHGVKFYEELDDSFEGLLSPKGGLSYSINNGELLGRSLTKKGALGIKELQALKIANEAGSYSMSDLNSLGPEMRLSAEESNFPTVLKGIVAGIQRYYGNRPGNDIFTNSSFKSDFVKQGKYPKIHDTWFKGFVTLQQEGNARTAANVLGFLTPAALPMAAFGTTPTGIAEDVFGVGTSGGVQDRALGGEWDTSPILKILIGDWTMQDALDKGYDEDSLKSIPPQGLDADMQKFQALQKLGEDNKNSIPVNLRGGGADGFRGRKVPHGWHGLDNCYA